MAARRGSIAPGANPDAPPDAALSEQEAQKVAARRARHERSRRIAAQRRAAAEQELAGIELPSRSATATDNPIPAPPFWGSRVVKGIALAEYAAMLDERATFFGQWGLRGARGGSGPSYEELVETEGRPRLRYWLDRFQSEGIIEAGVVYGYFPGVSKGDDLIVLTDDRHGERTRFTFPRQARDKRLCLADYFRPEESGEIDVVPFMVVTIGPRITEFAHQLFEAGNFRDYLEVHGLSVQLAEALAEYWHRRIRAELRFPDGSDAAASDPAELTGFFDLQYRGARYAFGYPACPDLEDQTKIVELLQPERIGVRLSEEFMLDPEQSTSAIVAHHPEATYFAAR